MIESLRQLIYVSEAVSPADRRQIEDIVVASRRNNAIDGITGLLWSDGERFLQVLEGSAEAVGATFARITRDPRHRDIVTTSDRPVDEREFGGWSMEYRDPAHRPDEIGRRLHLAMTRSSPAIREVVRSMVAGGG